MERWTDGKKSVVQQTKRKKQWLSCQDEKNSQGEQFTSPLHPNHAMKDLVQNDNKQKLAKS